MAEETTCPVCGITVDIHSVFMHLFVDHSDFLLVWVSLMNPEEPDDFVIEHYLNLYSLAGNAHPQDEYTYYSELCDYIGYHKVGVKEIDVVAPVVTCASETTCDTCAICLENIHNSDNIRVIDICKHMYCASCIERWLSENKTCPICKMILE